MITTPLGELLPYAKRPLIVAGNGIRLAGEAQRFRHVIQRWQIPFVTTWTGADLIPTEHPLNTGILGMCGQPGANKAVQECDFLLAIGTHLAIPHTTTLRDKFAPLARIVCVNIDKHELASMPFKAMDKIRMDLREWLDANEKEIPTTDFPSWREHCSTLKKLNAIGNPRASSGINSYVFNEMMTQMLPPGTCMVIDGGGTALYTGFQSSVVKEGSRLICSTSMSAMGSGLPEAVGACFGNGRRLTTCIVGDGSLMLNVQELQTIKHPALPIKIFVLNNMGYLAIRHTQDGFLGGRRYGVGASSANDISWPHIEGQARAYGIPYLRVSEREGAEAIVDAALKMQGPVLVEVMCPPDQEMRWKQSFVKEGDRFVPQTLDKMEGELC